MKKIVTILAAAMLATSVFAADVAAQVKITGNVFNYDGTDFKLFQANEYSPSDDSNIMWKMSVAGDKAGADIWAWSKDGNTTAQYVWFKPVDSLKLTVGNINIERLFRPQFGWWAATTKFDMGDTGLYGYGIDYKNGALKLQFAMAPGAGNYFFDFSKEGYAAIGNFWFLAQYAFDFATFELYATKGGRVQPHGFFEGSWTGEDLAIGLSGGTWNYMQNCYFADFAVAFAKTADAFDFKKLVGTVYGQYFINGIGLQLINVVEYEAEKFVYGFEFRGTYALDGFTPFIQIDGYNVMAEAYKVEVQLGTSLNVGACKIDTWLSVPIQSGDFTISMPIKFDIAF